MTYEGLGVFYLGRPYDLATKSDKQGYLLYDSKDLVTHGVCVGMTGSGKTGLCLALLEEAAIDNIPAILVDPKGDLANLLLTFPDLKPEDFRPWIQESEAARKNMSPDDFAAQQAQLWKDGLAKWDQDGDRIRRLREAVDMVIYTPGSEAGVPVSVLKSFSSPPADLIDDRELFRERVGSTATAILSLIIDGDFNPLQSKEHILLSQILDSAWRNGKDLDLAALISQIQTPPFQRVGVLELDAFYPANERFELAMKLNALLASPGFEAWMHGESLDIDKILYTEKGKPRIAIFSIAHLSDQERMFFVSLLLNQTLSWMRRQTGTTSLRALFYMDEIFGYLPPVKNPPSKQPMLTLMKQARAFGLGVLLATQNPVDIDYKALSNAGTWFIGRLQTDRDQARVLDGLEGTAAGTGAKFDRGAMQQVLAGLGNRVFLLYDVHRPEPEIFESRWAMSYLRGPLTRSQIKQLMDPRKAEHSVAAAAAGAGSGAVKPAATVENASPRPILAPDVPQTFLPVRSAQRGNATLHYEPSLVCVAQVQLVDAKTGVNEVRAQCMLVPFVEGVVPLDWQSAAELPIEPTEFEGNPQEEAQFGNPPAPATKVKSYSAWSKECVNWLYTNVKVELLKSPSLGEISNTGEDEKAFRLRLDQAAREERDRLVEALRAKYATKIQQLQDKVRNAEFTLQRQQQEAQQSKIDSATSVLGSVVSAIFGRGQVTTGVAAAGRAYGKISRESTDVAKAQGALDSAKQQLADLEARIEQETAAVSERVDPLTEPLDKIVIKPKKTNISVQLVSLGWAPYWVEGADQSPAWE